MSDLSGALSPLPRGRHNLSRDDVERSQRLRLCIAMADACGQVGYADTSVKVILERANVSRLTFYELYDSKLDCFLDALDVVGEVLVVNLRGASERGGDPLERAERSVDRYLDAIVNNLPFARLYIVEAHAAGPAALTRRAELQAQIVAQLARQVRAKDDDARFACEAYVAAVSALVTLPVATGDVKAIRALRGPLVGLMQRLLG
jgi:AcrR family transcriptional regulator